MIRDWPAFKNSKLKTHLFSFFFVSGAQSAVDAAIAFPVIIEAHAPVHLPLGTLDIIAAVVMFALLIMETIADQQHWNYQEPKWEAIKAKKPLTPEQKQGFMSTGMRRYSRHPNYFAEFMHWFTFYLFSVSTSGCWLNICILGPIGLFWMIHGATVMIEDLAEQKYPTFKNYRKAVPMFIPMPCQWKIKDN